MHQHERHRLIVERARANIRVDVAELAAEFNVTPETIRRDLTTLEGHRLVRRVHGGAVAPEQLGFEPSVATRATRLLDEKQRIARKALDYLPVSGSIALDAGTTTMFVAQFLPTDREFTVITSSPAIAMVLLPRDNVTVHILGGVVRSRTLATVGHWAWAQLQDVFIDVAFMGANGVSLKAGLTTPESTEAHVKTAMMRAAGRSVLLVDHTKVGDSHFSRFGSLSEVSTIISDSNLAPEAADDLRTQGPEVVLA